MVLVIVTVPSPPLKVPAVAVRVSPTTGLPLSVGATSFLALQVRDLVLAQVLVPAHHLA